MIVEGQPNVSGAVADGDPDHAVPLAPGSPNPALEHAGNSAGEFETVGDDPAAVIGRQRERHVEVDPYCPGAHRVAAGDALAAMGTDPPERHALLPGRSWVRF